MRSDGLIRALGRDRSRNGEQTGARRHQSWYIWAGTRQRERRRSLIRYNQLRASQPRSSAVVVAAAAVVKAVAVAASAANQPSRHIRHRRRQAISGRLSLAVQSVASIARSVTVYSIYTSSPHIDSAIYIVCRSPLPARRRRRRAAMLQPQRSSRRRRPPGHRCPASRSSLSQRQRRSPDQAVRHFYRHRCGSRRFTPAQQSGFSSFFVQSALSAVK